MRVLIVGGFATDSLYSMEGYAGSLTEGVRALGVSADFIQPIARASKGVSGPLAKYLAYYDKFVIFRQELEEKAEDYDVVHICDQGYAMYCGWTGSTPTVLTVHDLLAVRSGLGELDWWKTRWTGRQLQEWIRQSLNHADFVTCVSEATRQDLLRLTSITEGHTSVIHNCFYKDLSSEPRKRQDFLHHIGANQPYKNRAGAVRIASKFLQLPGREDWRFVMMGKAPDKTLSRVIAESPVKDRIDVMVRPPDEEVLRVTAESSGLLFPSISEGFGLPILEAMTAGCRVFTSFREPMKTVAGNAGVLIDPSDLDEAAEIIDQALQLPAPTELMANNLERFSKEDSLRKIVELYKAVAV
jgi:glycosyltransferase involved in cell wall biosynthesis